MTVGLWIYDICRRAAHVLHIESCHGLVDHVVCYWLATECAIPECLGERYL
jgi:hypothetical protein